jgi:hypothetical protein
MKEIDKQRESAEKTAKREKGKSAMSPKETRSTTHKQTPQQMGNIGNEALAMFNRFNKKKDDEKKE